MENENDEKSQDKKKLVAKDLVDLEHVEIKKQKVSQETKNLADALKDKVKGPIELSNDEITLLESFMGKRMFLTRIAIVVNQSRIPLGIEPLKKADLEGLLKSLIQKGLTTSEIVGDKTVYFLTEKGKERVQ